ncbi:MAG TPA: helix-turn-helix domain-containing protein [Chloroflexia bacterium]
MNNDKGLVLNDAARVLRLSTKTVTRHVQAGKLRGEKREGRWYVYLPEAHIEQAQAELSATQAQVNALREENTWLRHLVDETTAINRGLALALQNCELRVKA